MLLAVITSLGLFLSLASASSQIVSGATWTALDINEHVQAHGGGLIDVDGVYYWAGENKLNGTNFQSINCYSSTDLVTWTFVNELLSVQTAAGDLGPDRIVERPHIMYNAEFDYYVMWMHIDSSSYGEAKAGVATSDEVCGDYTYLGSTQPLGFQSRDMSVFVDTDGSGYLLTEDRANGLRIDKLSANYTVVEEATFLFSPNPYYEAPAIHKTADGTYFFFASHQSGWAPNDNLYTTATSLSGPWANWTTFGTVDTDTYYSQTTAVVEIDGLVMYMGDRWNASNLMASTYIWLPLNISGTTASMANHEAWILESGSASLPPFTNSYLASSSANTLSSGAVRQSCSGCSNLTSVGYIGGTTSPGGTLTFPDISSSIATTTTIQIIYANGDAIQRYANVVVNGVANTVAFLPTTSGNAVKSSVLTVGLKEGSDNVITIEGVNDGWGPDIDQLIVPVS